MLFTLAFVINIIAIGLTIYMIALFIFVPIHFYITNKEDEKEHEKDIKKVRRTTTYNNPNSTVGLMGNTGYYHIWLKD